MVNAFVGKLVGSPAGGLIVSILLGLGAASIFRGICVGPECVVTESPDPETLSKKILKYDDGC